MYKTDGLQIVNITRVSVWRFRSLEHHVCACVSGCVADAEWVAGGRGKVQSPPGGLPRLE